MTEVLSALACGLFLAALAYLLWCLILDDDDPDGDESCPPPPA